MKKTVPLIILLLITITCGKKNADDIHTQESAPEQSVLQAEEWTPVAIALQGAVVTDVSKTILKYEKKCEKCGNLSGSVITGFFVGNRSASFICPKCKNRQKILIKCSRKEK